MRLKEAIQHTSGLRCVVEGMEICSSVGRRMLHEMTWLGEESAITAEHDRIASVLRLLETEAGRDRTETIRRKLAQQREKLQFEQFYVVEYAVVARAFDR